MGGEKGGVVSAHTREAELMAACELNVALLEKVKRLEARVKELEHSLEVARIENSRLHTRLEVA